MFDKEQAIERVTRAAVDAARSKGANYAHIIFPSSFGPSGINLNALRDIYVAYYKCGSLPAPNSQSLDSRL